MHGAVLGFDASEALQLAYGSPDAVPATLVRKVLQEAQKRTDDEHARARLQAAEDDWVSKIDTPPALQTVGPLFRDTVNRIRPAKARITRREQ